MASNITKAFKQKAKLGLRHYAAGTGQVDITGLTPGTSTVASGNVGAGQALGEIANAGRVNNMSSALSKWSDMQSADAATRGANYQWQGLGNTTSAADPKQFYTPSMDPNTVRLPTGDAMRSLDKQAAVYDIQHQRKPVPNLMTINPIAKGLREGGIVQDFTGKGNPDKDTVPAMLADGEAVLPAKTVQSMGGPEAVEELIEQTNGKPSATAQQKKGLRGVLHAANGGPVVLRNTPYLRGGATNDTPDEYTQAVGGTPSQPAAAPVHAMADVIGQPAVPVAPQPVPAAPKNEWWRGKATAADFDNQLMTTPQHAQAQEAELQARGVSVPDNLAKAAANERGYVATAADTTKKPTATSEAELNRGEDLRNKSMADYDPQEAAVNASWALRDDLQKARGGGYGDAASGSSSIRALAGNKGLRDQFNANQELTGRAPGNSGAIKVDVDSNGRLVLSGKDVKGAAGLSGYDMKKDIESMQKANEIRQQMIDGQRTDIDQGVYKTTGNAGLAQAVKEGKLSAGDALNMHASMENNKSTAGMRQALADVQKGHLDLQGKQFEELARHNKAVEAATAAAIRRQMEQQGIQDMDQLIANAGFEGKDANGFRDFFRHNFAGRRQTINGREEDVKGFEDMNADERRHYMPEAMAKYKLMQTWNDKRLAGSGGSSNSVPEKVRERNMTLDDVAAATGLAGKLGMPKLYSDDPNDPGLFGEGSYASRHWNPISDYDKTVLEEVGPNGKGQRKVFKGTLRNADHGPYGSRDTMQWLGEHKVK